MEHNTSNTVTNNAPQRPYAQPSAPGGRRKPSLKIVVIAAAIVLLTLLAVFAALKFGSFGGIVKKSQYQAVFLTNGQVYFGKLQNTSGQYLRLTDVYYLQASTDLQATDGEEKTEEDKAKTTQQLIRLGNEIHGPEGEMIVSREQVLFFENIKSDGTVGKAIAKDKEGKN